MLKVIFHVDQEENWPLVLANAENFYREVPEAAIIILANAKAVLAFKKPELTATILASKGQLLLCGNALRGHHISEDSLPAEVTVVPSGVVELAVKQSQGYAYIRP